MKRWINLFKQTNHCQRSVSSINICWSFIIMYVLWPIFFSHYIQAVTNLHPLKLIYRRQDRNCSRGCVFDVTIFTFKYNEKNELLGKAKGEHDLWESCCMFSELLSYLNCTIRSTRMLLLRLQVKLIANYWSWLCVWWCDALLWKSITSIFLSVYFYALTFETIINCQLSFVTPTNNKDEFNYVQYNNS